MSLPIRNTTVTETTGFLQSDINKFLKQGSSQASQSTPGVDFTPQQKVISRQSTTRASGFGDLGKNIGAALSIGFGGAGALPGSAVGREFGGDIVNPTQTFFEGNQVANFSQTN